LIIGDGVGGVNADIVRYINANGNQIYAGRTIIINNSGLFDLNGHSDDVGPIYMDGANITTGAGTLQLSVSPLTTYSSTNGGSAISGNFQLATPSIFAISNSLTMNAAVSGAAAYSLTNKARLYWDTSAGGYLLEADSNLMVNAWGTITNEPIVNGGNYNVTNSSVLPNNRFYTHAHK
jgi:hypothetical protein